MRTAVNWLQSIQDDNQIITENMFDMVVVFGRGVLWRIPAFQGLNIHPQDQNHRWAYMEQSERNLFFMFSHMLSWFSSTSLMINAQNYSANVHFENVITA